jgi:hypothetical protein
VVRIVLKQIAMMKLLCLLTCTQTIITQRESEVLMETRNSLNGDSSRFPSFILYEKPNESSEVEYIGRWRHKLAASHDS